MKLLVFTRYPEAGAVKTRLAGALGDAGAADLHRAMTEHTLRRLRRLQARTEVWFCGGTEGAMRAWLGDELNYRVQGPGDLGDRLCAALRYSFERGEDKVVVVGADCPDLRADHVEEAVQLLDHHPVVLGPAADGGYYLLALRAFHGDLFRSIPWGTDRVRIETSLRAEGLGLEVGYLEDLSDVDRPEDLPHWYRVFAPGRASCGSPGSPVARRGGRRFARE